MTYDEIKIGYEQSLALLKKVDKKVYKLFIKNLNLLNPEDLSSLMACLKEDIRVKQACQDGTLQEDDQPKALMTTYKKGQADTLTIGILKDSRIFTMQICETTRKNNKNLTFFLSPINQDKLSLGEEQSFASVVQNKKNTATTSSTYSVCKIPHSYYIFEESNINKQTKEATVKTLQQEKTNLTTPVVGY